MQFLLVIGLLLLCWLPVFADTAIEQGIQSLDRQDFAEAVKLFTQTIDQFPGVSYANRCLANLLLEDYKMAEADCSQALAYLPDRSDIWLDRGMTRYHQGNYQQAIDDFNQGIDLNGQDYRLYYDRGLAFGAMGNSQNAVRDYGRAIALAPKQPDILAEILTDRGVEYLFRQDFRVALTDFDRALELNPDNARLMFNRGCAHLNLQEFELALTDFDRAIELEPKNPEFYRSRGLVYRQLGFRAKALADLDRAAINFLAQGKWNEYQVVELLKAQLISKKMV